MFSSGRIRNGRRLYRDFVQSIQPNFMAALTCMLHDNYMWVYVPEEDLKDLHIGQDGLASLL